MIHWLNNKAIVHDTGIERIMMETLTSDCSTEPSEIENSIKSTVLTSYVIRICYVHNSKILLFRKYDAAAKFTD